MTVSDDVSLPAQGPRDLGLIRPALRWVLLCATATLLTPGTPGVPLPFVQALLLLFLLSNVVLTLLPRSFRAAPRVAYAVVIGDTFFVSTALFYAGVDGGRFVTVFFLLLLLAVIGADMRRLLAGASLIAGLYVYLVAGNAGASGLVPLLARLPFLFVVTLYYGHIAQRVREHDERYRRTEREKSDLQAFLEITTATNSTLDLHRILFV